MSQQNDPKKQTEEQKEGELSQSDLDQASGGAIGVSIGSFGNLAGTSPKAKIKVGGVGNWDEDAK